MPGGGSLSPSVVTPTESPVPASEKKRKFDEIEEKL